MLNLTRTAVTRQAVEVAKEIYRAANDFNDFTWPDNASEQAPDRGPAEPTAARPTHVQLHLQHPHRISD